MKHIAKLIKDSFTENKDRNAIFHNNTYYSYKELHNSSIQIANFICNITLNSNTPIIIMSNHSFFAYAGIFGTILTANFYVPLNEEFPESKNIDIIKKSNAKIIILDKNNFKNYENILDKLNGYHILVENSNEELNKKFNNFFYNINNFSTEININIQYEENNNIYLLFTSGSTGTPKGIEINNKNIYAYIEAFLKRNKIQKNDRFLQMNDLTFDLSAHSIFLSSIHGSCIYFINKSQKLKPIEFINEHNITHILFVPSTISILKKLRLLKDNIMKTVNYISFCGETLPFNDAILFAKGCPNAKLENLYGPTEATIACTYFQFTKDSIEKNEYCGSMPIGYPNYKTEIELINQNEKNIGEIAISGPQVANGYFNNPLLTKEKFIKIKNTIYYKTGDLGKKFDDYLIFLGRNDTQVQIRGYRVEIFEIENALSKIDGIISNAVIPTPVDAATYESTTAFLVCSKDIEIDNIKDSLAKTLPQYMIPSKYIIIDNMPLNANGKIDRNHLKKLI